MGQSAAAKENKKAKKTIKTEATSTENVTDNNVKVEQTNKPVENVEVKEETNQENKELVSQPKTVKKSGPLFKVFDVLFSFILSIFSYIFLALKAIYKITLRRPIIEIYLLLKAFYDGTAYVLEFLFIGVPSFIYGKISKPIINTYYKTKESLDKIKKKGIEEQQSGKTFTAQVR